MRVDVFQMGVRFRRRSYLKPLRLHDLSGFFISFGFDFMTPNDNFRQNNLNHLQTDANI